MHWLWPTGLVVGGVWLLSSKAKAAVSTSATQKMFQNLITAEARKQGVPVEFALANAELESNFKDVKAANGESYGPLQVHVSALKPGETKAQLMDYSWSIPRGISIMKDRLKKAEGVSELARIMYFCGPGWKTSCSQGALDNTINRWRPVAAKWGVQPRY